MIKSDELKDLLEHKYHQYNTSSFIEEDPISIPHQFSNKQDIEIAAFFAATLAWGQRPIIIRNAKHLLNLMDHAPHDFICNFEVSDLARFQNFKHRTFNGEDCENFLSSLQYIYRNHHSLDDLFKDLKKEHLNIASTLSAFKEFFFKSYPHTRTQKHIADPLKGSSAKRLNMFLRWMVRKDSSDVDFGIWDSFDASELYCPLDAHTSRVSRKFGILSRKQNDWKAVEELTSKLRILDPSDPVKYDFALFGLGIYEDF